MIEENIASELHARLWFSESIPPRGALILVHGLGDHGGRFKSFANRVADKGLAVYAMDLPGHGLSPGRRGIATRYDNLLQTIATSREIVHRRLPGVPQALVGHSMGGNLAINYSLRRHEFEPLSLQPLSAAVLVAPMLMPPQPMDRSKVFAAWGTGHLLRPLRLSKPAQVHQLTADVEMAEEILSDSLQHHQISLYLATQLLAQGRFALDHAGQNVTPTLVMYGDRDELIDQSACRNLALRMLSGKSLGSSPRCEIFCQPGGLHDLLHDVEADRCTDALIQWLEKICLEQPNSEPITQPNPVPKPVSNTAGLRLVG